jgi:putative transposase
MERYSLTLCTFEREQRFTSPDVVEPARSQLLHKADDFQFAIPAYCFMPDHLHILALGESPDSDLEAFVYKMKQKTGFEFKKTGRAPLWQDGYYDRVLRSDEQTLVVAKYILENPVRAGLAAAFDTYPFSGSNRYTMQQLADVAESQD